MSAPIMTGIALAIALSSRGASTLACSIDDIHIKEWNWRVEYKAVWIIGEIVNNCAEPIGVELRATVRNANGDLVDVEEFWPASIQDIEPNSPYPFKYGFSHTSPDVATVDIKVIEVQEWKKRKRP